MFYGLTLDVWNNDERQIYLLGLKWYTSGEWPYFGADVIYTQRSIPGALQAILVGLGFFLLPAPEAPIVVLNLLSLATLVVLRRYLSKFWYGMADYIYDLR